MKVAFKKTFFVITGHLRIEFKKKLKYFFLFFSLSELNWLLHCLYKSLDQLWLRTIDIFIEMINHSQQDHSEIRLKLLSKNETIKFHCFMSKVTASHKKNKIKRYAIFFPSLSRNRQSTCECNLSMTCRALKCTLHSAASLITHTNWIVWLLLLTVSIFFALLPRILFSRNISLS